MKRPSSVILLAGVVLLVVSGLLATKAWRTDRSHPPSSGESSPGGHANPLTRKRVSSEDLSPGVHTTERGRAKEEKKELLQISELLGDDSVTPEMAAGKLWKLAADSARSEAVRSEALTHALNLTDDETYRSEVLPLLGKGNVWPDSLGEKILDDLYDRPEDLKIQGTGALFGNSTGELHTNLRKLLVVVLEDPEVESLSDAELIRRARDKVK